MNVELPFEHAHAAHCETGVIAGILRFHGFSISEPMAFGLGNGISYAYLPFMKMGNLPVISYRIVPGFCIRTCFRRLGAGFFAKRFSYRRQREAMDFVDRKLSGGQAVGLQTSAYFSTYFPPEMRFQFNGHNIIVYGKKEGTYLISDPVFDHPVTMEEDDLRKARFARGFSAPKGLVHYPLWVNPSVDIRPLIPKAIRLTWRIMLHAPGIFGVRGMIFLSGVIEKMPARKDPFAIRRFIGHMVRMQEEIGTGGGGFRFLYAAFLQEAGELLDCAPLSNASQRMTETGDRWRFLASSCASAIKRKSEPIDCAAIARELRDCAAAEKDVYLALKKIFP